ncbi:MAG TPA: DNA-binding response regulator [Bacteroidales bacterium]|nr:DNA-binding response regulator [Bacteroidales bacterium]
MNALQMGQEKFKIVIVDDHALFREGLRLLIEKEGIGKVVAEADNGLKLLEIVKTYLPDVIIMDIDMPIMNGYEATEKVIQQYPEANILVLSMHGDQEHYSQLVKAGAKGFVLKTSGKHELENAIRCVAKGDSFFSSELLRRIIVDLSKPSTTQNRESVKIDFTDRELEVLKLFCSGYAVSEIADKLFLSIKTIEAHRSKLILKTETKNTIGLILFAIKNKIVTV